MTINRIIRKFQETDSVEDQKSGEYSLNGRFHENIDFFLGVLQKALKCLLDDVLNKLNSIVINFLGGKSEPFPLTSVNIQSVYFS